jgi:hypothetical protein
MPGENDDDYDGVDAVRTTWFGAPAGKKKKMKWNRFKWILFAMNTIVGLRTSDNISPSLNLFVTVLDLLACGSHRLPHHMVQHLDQRRRRARR